jgi:hypothetical protein
MFEEIKNIRTSIKDFRSFGITIGIILLVIAGFLFIKEKESYQVFLYIAVALLGLGYIIPAILKPIYIVWMVFALILGWLMTRVILILVYYIILTPIGIITKLFGEDFLKLKKSNVGSYWNTRDSEIELHQDYEKQF